MKMVKDKKLVVGADFAGFPLKEAVVAHLIAKGIDTDRLVPKGYGETAPKMVTKKMTEQYPFMKEGDVLTESYILDEGWREWLNDNNPYALKEMIEDMLEAADRGLWDAPSDILDELRDLYLETEGDLEGFDPGM